MRQILFQIGKNLYRDFSDVANGLWRGLFELYAMSRVLAAFQIRQNVRRRRPQIWTALMDDDHFEKVLAVIRQNRRLTVREVAEEVGICKSSCHLILTEKLQMRRLVEKFVPRLLTDALLIREFLTKHETTVVPQPPYTPDLAPADFFLFSKLKSSLKGRQF